MTRTPQHLFPSKNDLAQLSQIYEMPESHRRFEFKQLARGIGIEARIVSQAGNEMSERTGMVKTLESIRHILGSDVYGCTQSKPK